MQFEMRCYSETGEEPQDLHVPRTCVPQKLIVVILLVVANWSMASCKKGNPLNHVEKVFEGKSSEHNKPSFLVTEIYAFLLAINCKENQLF